MRLRTRAVLAGVLTLASLSGASSAPLPSLEGARLDIASWRDAAAERGLKGDNSEDAALLLRELHLARGEVGKADADLARALAAPGRRVRARLAQIRQMLSQVTGCDRGAAGLLPDRP